MKGIVVRIAVAAVLVWVLSVPASSCGTSNTTSDETSPTPALSENTPSPTPPSDGWYLRVYNVDDMAKAYVNGTRVTKVDYGDDSGWVDITKYVAKTGGKTAIRFTTYNEGEGYCWGFKISRAPSDDPDSVVWRKKAGVCGRYGVNNNDYSRVNTMVFDKTVYVKDLPTPSAAP